MTFLFPLGLLGLIGIPVIIIIYILQSKYTEQTVSSTYLWKLSEKFLKRRNPLSGLAGMISLILQLLTVAAISLAIAHPVFTLPGAANDYCFILDTSASMSTVDGKTTLFEQAKEEIIDVIDSAANGSSYTLVTVSGETVVAFEGIKNKSTAKEFIRDLSADDTSSDSSVLLGAAQARFDENTSALIYVITDKGYEKHENVELISVGSKSTVNYAVYAPTYSHSGTKLKVEADVVAYNTSGTVKLILTVDGKEAATKEINIKSGEQTRVDLECKRDSFASFTLTVENEDGYESDNSVTVHNLQSDKTYSTLIVSDSGFFLEAVIDSLVDAEVKTVTPEEYTGITDKYGLYIFENCEPSTLPDGAVWLINPDESIKDSGFGIRGQNVLPTSEVIEKSKSTSSAVRKLLDGVDGSNIYVSNYIRYSGMYLNFYTLFSHGANPVIFAGVNGVGNRQVVFGFSLNESDFALSTDFVILIGNLLEYSFPSVLDEAYYTVGDEALVNILTNADGYKAVSPSGEDIYVDTSSATAVLTLDEIGTYTVTVTLAGREIPYRIYAAAHPSESKPATTEADISLSGEKTDSNIDGEFDSTALLFVILAVLFIADWGVYCYEKYQLR